jgi:serine/threonine protein kinase
VAIKKFFNRYRSIEEAQEEKEIAALKLFRHPNIVRFKRIEICNEKLYIVQEFMEMNLT